MELGAALKPLGRPSFLGWPLDSEHHVRQGSVSLDFLVITGNPVSVFNMPDVRCGNRLIFLMVHCRYRTERSLS
jgi:hypothetical protein